MKQERNEDNSCKSNTKKYNLQRVNWKTLVISSVPKNKKKEDHDFNQTNKSSNNP